MHHKIDRAAMARVLDLRNILELVDNGPFAHQQFIRQVHQMVLHVCAQSGDETPVPVPASNLVKGAET